MATFLMVFRAATEPATITNVQTQTQRITTLMSFYWPNFRLGDFMTRMTFPSAREPPEALEDLATCPQKGLPAMTNATLFVAQTHTIDGGNRFSSAISSQSPKRCCAAQLNFQPCLHYRRAPTKTTKNSRNFHGTPVIARRVIFLLQHCGFWFFLRGGAELCFLFQAHKGIPNNSTTHQKEQ